MRGNLEKVMPHVFAHEGGFVNHPRDPGGATNMGITIGTLRNARGNKPVTVADVKALTKDEATRIYEANYARPIRFDELPSGLDYAVLDYAINSGPSRAAKALQGLVDARQDGVIGPVTLTAVKARDTTTLIKGLCNERLAFLMRLATWPTFGKGWSRRVFSVRKTALQLNQGSVAAPAPVPVPVPPVPAPPAPTTRRTGTAIIIAAVVAVATAIGQSLGWF